MYELIHADRGEIPVARACRVLQVARSGYYQWLHAEPSGRSIDDAVLAAEIKEVFHEHKGRYGAPRIRRALGRRGVRPSKKRAARLMRAQGLRGHRLVVELARRDHRDCDRSGPDAGRAPQCRIRLRDAALATKPVTCTACDIAKHAASIRSVPHDTVPLQEHRQLPSKARRRTHLMREA